jgi:hypothetical protein
MNNRVAAIGHVGDSRLLVLRAGNIVDQTRDHNVREMGRRLGWETVGPTSGDPNASKLTRSLDQPLDGPEDIRTINIEQDDLILLCTDGVSQHLPEAPGSLFAGQADNDTVLIERVRELVAEAALQRQDNFTAIAIKLGAGEFRGVEASAAEDIREAIKSDAPVVAETYGRGNRMWRALDMNVLDVRQARSVLPMLAGVLVSMVLLAAVGVHYIRHTRADRATAQSITGMRIALEAESQRAGDLRSQVAGLMKTAEALMLEEAQELDAIRTAAAHSRFLRRYLEGPFSAHLKVQSVAAVQNELADLRMAHQSAMSTKNLTQLSKFLKDYGSGPFSNDPLVSEVRAVLAKANHGREMEW